jgi:hypothetical protein
MAKPIVLNVKTRTIDGMNLAEGTSRAWKVAKDHVDKCTMIAMHHMDQGTVHMAPILETVQDPGEPDRLLIRFDRHATRQVQWPFSHHGSNPCGYTDETGRRIRPNTTRFRVTETMAKDALREALGGRIPPAALARKLFKKEEESIESREELLEVAARIVVAEGRGSAR